jgi:hypothetical protein
MPIKSAPYYYAVCDNCGERADYDEFTAWEDPSQARDQAIAAEWTERDDRWHCPKCPPLDTDEDEAARQDGAP